jgi:membrane protein DedA with SNARE-associated domain
MASLGYPGLVLMMALESMIAPIPSEVVMPFAGFLVVEGRFTFLGATLASSSGTLLGSLASYLMGRWGGYPLVLRFGKYLLLDKHHLDVAHSWFEKRGEITVFVCRFVPIVRHLISIPAGVAGMNLWRFCVFSVIGGTIWNVILLYAGVRLGERWDLVEEYTHELDYVALAAIAAVALWWFWSQWRRRRAARKPAE